jgi:ligand-binding sensor domain-containing protein
MRNSLIVLFLFLSSSLWGEEPYYFSNLSLKNGLSQTSVLCSFQDSQGYIWFGTRYGLNKFNGYGFQIFLTESGISDNHILCITEDNDNNLWVGTNYGLNQLDLSTNQFKRYFNDPEQENSLSNANVSALLFDKNNHLWVGTYNGLNLYDPKTDTFQDINPDGVFTNNPINSIYLADDKTLLIGTKLLGLVTLNPENNTYTLPNSNPNDPNRINANDIRAIFIDSHKNLWIGTNGAGLKLRKNGDSDFSEYNESNGLTNNYIRCIKESPQGDILIGTFNGLNVIKPATKEIIQYKSYDSRQGDLSHFSIYSILFDRDQTLWVGTYAGGIDYFNPYERAFQFYNPGLENNMLLGIIGPMVRQGSTIYIATEGGGLLAFDIHKKTYKQHPLNNKEAYGQNILKSLYVDGNSILCGTNVGTLYRFDLQTQKFSLIYRLEEENSIYAILRDSTNNIWIGDIGGVGLVRIAPDKTVTTQFPTLGGETIAFSNIRCILEIKKNVFLIGTRGAGLYRYDVNNKMLIQYKQNADPTLKGILPQNYITSLLKDSKGNIWIGTFGGGLCLFNQEEGSFTSFGKEQNLYDNNICMILESQDKHLWLSTTSGISDFDPQQQVFKNYTNSNGIAINEFSPHAGLLLPDGRMLFSGDNGFVSFNPKNLFLNPHIPPIVLDNLFVNNRLISPNEEDGILKKQIGWTHEIVLKYNQSNIEIGYSALNYISTSRNRYAYKLEGFDTDWIDAGQRRMAYIPIFLPENILFG